MMLCDGFARLSRMARATPDKVATIAANARVAQTPLALARRSESFAGSGGGCAAPVRDLDY